MNVNRPAESFMVLPGMKPVYTEDPNRPGERRLPGFSWLPNRVRYLFISMLGEFVGTALFLTFAFAATQVANTPPNDSVDSPPSASTLLYISLAFGFSLLVNAWIFFRISGGLFNPAVRIGAASADHCSPLVAPHTDYTIRCLWHWAWSVPSAGSKSFCSSWPKYLGL